VLPSCCLKKFIPKIPFFTREYLLRADRLL
jgi:hypothetical protein